MPEWLTKTEQALQGLLSLPENWNSYGARPIDPLIVNAAMQLLRDIVRHETPQPAIVPTIRGGVQIEWHTCGIDLEIEITSPGKFHVSYENPQENAEGDLELSSDLTPLAQLTATLSRLG